MRVGEWSEAIYDVFNIEDEDVRVAYYLWGIRMAEDGSTAKLYVSHVMNIEDASYYYPQEPAAEMLRDLGPMLYFGTFERHTKEADDIVLEMFKKLHDWHIAATKWLFDKYEDW